MRSNAEQNIDLTRPLSKESIDNLLSDVSRYTPSKHAQRTYKRENLLHEFSSQVKEQSNEQEDEVNAIKKRELNPYEQFSNPTEWPGFDKLSKEEKLRRIKDSFTDPANQSTMGTFVQPGTYESKTSRILAHSIPIAMMPEMEFASPLIKYGVNALARIGAGTASDISYQSPNLKSKNDIKDLLKESVKANALLESLLFPIRNMPFVPNFMKKKSAVKDITGKLKKEKELIYKNNENESQEREKEERKFIAMFTPEGDKVDVHPKNVAMAIQKHEFKRA